jgi:hypothetical protein
MASGRWYIGGDPGDTNNRGVAWDGPGLPVPSWVIVTVVVVVALGGLSLLTGVPGPGPMRRYPVAELNETADRINRAATSSSASAGVRSVGEVDGPAAVDLWRSRVIVNQRASVCAIGLSPDELAMVVVTGTGEAPTCGT